MHRYCFEKRKIKWKLPACNTQALALAIPCDGFFALVYRE